MYRYSELETARQHIQEMQAEADRNRQIRASGILEARRQNSWRFKLWRGLPALLARWNCAIQTSLAQGFFGDFNPAASRLSVFKDPCACAPTICSD